MKRKPKTREYYQYKFAKLFSNCNYIPQENEIIVQCNEQYPPYWFISNKGYLFSAYRNTLEILRPVFSKDKKNDWKYQYNEQKNGQKHLKQPRMHVLIAEHFLENEFAGYEEVEGENIEVHHKTPRNNFGKYEGQFANRADSLQLLPESIHDDVTKLANLDVDGFEKKIEKEMKKGVPCVQLTEEVEAMIFEQIKKHVDAGKLATFISLNSKGTAQAEPVKRMEKIKDIFFDEM